jgi:hypothetical protein
MYPSDAREDLRKYLGRFGVSGKMQVQKMDELSDGQKSRVVFAKLGRDVPHILLLVRVLIQQQELEMKKRFFFIFFHSCVPKKSILCVI